MPLRAFASTAIFHSPDYRFIYYAMKYINILLTPNTLLNLLKKVKEIGLDSEQFTVLNTSTKLNLTSSMVKALSDK